MPFANPLAAVHTIEVEIDVSGVAEAADPSVGYSGGYADLSVDGVFGLKYVRRSHPSQWTRFDILAGLDAKSRAIVLANIEAQIGHDAICDALEAEASDPMADRADDLRDQRRDDAMMGLI